MSEYLKKQAVLEWLDDRRYKSPWIESFRKRLESGAFDVTLKGVEEYYSLQYKHGQTQQEIRRLRKVLKEVYEELKTLHFMIDRDDNIFHEQKKKYLSTIDYVGQSVAGQALSTTTETINAEKVERVREGDGNIYENPELVSAE